MAKGAKHHRGMELKGVSKEHKKHKGGKKKHKGGKKKGKK
jgi:hypothetical protein